MPLPLPTLDRLTYDELVSEARSSLPALAPAWTDYNAHDPGITLLELVAWLAEGASYRLDNIPDESIRAFLRLTGVVPRAAQVAETLLMMRPIAAALSLPSGARVQAQDGSVQFQTSAELFVSDANLAAVVSGVGSIYQDVTLKNKPSSAVYLPFGDIPQLGDALYLGFDRAFAPVDSVMSVGVWTGHEVEDLATRTQLEVEQNAIADEAQRLCAGLPTDQVNWLQHYAARTVWEYYSSSKQWQPLKNVVDHTRALTLSGTVRFTAPGDQARGGVPLSAQSSNYFIRCRLARGAYDCPPRIAYVALNVVTARHAVDQPPQIFRSSGRAGQTFELAQKPIAPGSTGITVALNGVADGAWLAALAWDGVGPHDRIYITTPDTAAVTFGDGRIGRVPAAGAEIKVNYQVGGGARGNVAAGSLIQTTNTPPVTVQQPFAACGGSAAETLNQAKARAVREFITPTRAVTLADFETLALATPGVPVARAHVIPDYHPAMPCIPVSGSTSVVVLPPCPEQRPEPTAALLTSVQRYLERRRLLTSEVHVIAPHYTTVAIRARLRARADVDLRALARLARAALEQFFHPLHGGPDGNGWPIGRAVYRSEVLALLNDLDGVSHLEEMTWHVDGLAASRCGNITLCRHGLVASGIHEITINEGSVCHE